MARLTVGLVFGVVVGIIGGAALQIHAADAGGSGEDVAEAAPEPVLNPAIEKRLDCISYYESKGNPGATNPTSKAAGLFQFLWSTWAGTPQGRVGLSPYDPVAARAAARWMLSQGRAREWVPVQRGLC